MERFLSLVLVVGACGPATPGGGAADAGHDAGVDPVCGTAALPGWAARIDATTIEARCDGASVEVAAFDDEIVRLRYRADGAEVIARPWSQLVLPAAASDVTIGGDGDAALVCAPGLRVRVDAACRVTVRDGGGRALIEDVELRVSEGGAAIVRATPADEHFYGLGERTGPLDRRGYVHDFWNTDAYDSELGGWRPDQDPLYQAIPFVIGLRDGVAYGVFTDDTRRLSIDLAATDPARWSVATPARAIDQYVIAGPRLRDVVRRYTALTGRTPLPPRWALGYHQSRWGYASSTRVLEVARGFRERGIGADALWLDIQHMRGFRTFTWDPVAFADPVGLVAALAAEGFALTVIADPGIKIDPGWDVYDEGVAGGHFLDAEGIAWPGPVRFPDFTRPETRAWWGARVGGLVQLGVRGVWLDLNEPTTFPEGGGGATVPDDVPTSGGATMGEVHNVYAVLEADATWRGMRDAAPSRRPFVLSRAGAAGIQRYAAVWTGDAPSTWATLDQTLPMLLGMGLSGVPFVGSDVGGYSGGATPELFARWVSLGAVSPFFRGHVTTGVNDQEPWAFGAEVEEIARRAIAARYRRMPYLYSLFAEAEATGAPVLRPLAWEFQDDPRTWALDDEAMLGAHVLVAPVTVEGAVSRSVYLPAGRWIDARSGAVFDGPATIEVGVTLAALPTFLRAGAIVPGEGADGALELDVVAGDGAQVLHEDAGDGYGPSRAVTYEVAVRDGTVTLTGWSAGAYQPVSRTLRVRVRPIDRAPTAARLDGAPVSARFDANDRAVIVELADRDAFTLELDVDLALEPRPRVVVPVEVALPPGTPVDAVIHVASSANGWAHQPLERVDATHARGTLEVERGAWFLYKYTRGSWDTVEKHADCGEVTNRYRYGAADDAPVDAVARWRDDGC